MKYIIWITLTVLLGIAGVCAAVAINGLILMLLWNWILPYVFGLPEITFWMATGISILVSLLFGGCAHKFKK